jgi:hypothetical protein
MDSITVSVSPKNDGDAITPEVWANLTRYEQSAIISIAIRTFTSRNLPYPDQKLYEHVIKCLETNTLPFKLYISRIASEFD